MGNLRFADDIAVLAEEELELQDSVDRIAVASGKMGMQINAEKTEIQYLVRGSRNFQIQINGQQLKQTDNFVYLGGTISSNGGSENDVTRRIGLARGIFQNLNQIPPLSVPISIMPILSRLLEKQVARMFLYPILSLPNVFSFFQDQFAFRPTGSTTAQWRSNGLCRLCNAQGSPAIKGPPAIRGALSNLKGPRKSEGPHQSEELPAI